MLDLASGRLDAGDLAAATDLLSESDTIAESQVAFRWRNHMRARLIRARLAVAAEDFTGARQIARPLIEDTGRLGAQRYEVQAVLVDAIASARLGEAIVLETVSAVLARVDRLDGLEGWRLTADVADAFAVDGWRRLSITRAAAPIGRADEHTDTCKLMVAARLG